MKEYIKPILDIYEFDTEDEITASTVYERGRNNAVYDEYITQSGAAYQENMIDNAVVDYEQAGLWTDN